MTVEDLIAELKRENPKAKVFIQLDRTEKK